MTQLYHKDSVTMFYNDRCYGQARYEVHHNTVGGIRNYIFNNLGDAYRQYNLLLRS